MSFPDSVVAPRIEPRRRNKLDRPGATARNNPFNQTGEAKVAPTMTKHDIP